MKKRWMQSVMTAADQEAIVLPWARGPKRKARKAAARSRARAA